LLYIAVVLLDDEYKTNCDCIFERCDGTLDIYLRKQKRVG
jgi:hypothetical protein